MVSIQLWMCCRFTNINNSLEKYVTHCKCILTILLNLAPVDKRIGFFYKYDCAFYLKFSAIINRSISLRGGENLKTVYFYFLMFRVNFHHLAWALSFWIILVISPKYWSFLISVYLFVFCEICLTSV